MPVVLNPGAQPDFAPSKDPGQGPIYLPNVNQLRGTNSLEAVVTLNSLTLNTLVQFTVGTDLLFFKLLPNAADTSIPNIEVAPLDYNATTNNVHWRLVGGFGINLMAAARVTNSGNISIPNNLNTALTFDTSRFSSGEWDSTTNPSRITCLVDGIYNISASVTFAANASGTRKLAIRKNGSNEIASSAPVGTSTSAGTASTVDLVASTTAKLVAGDYVEMTVLQTSGGDLNVLQSDQKSPEFSAVRLSSLTPVESDPTIPVTDTTGVANEVQDLSLTDAGWYRIWQGAYPSSGSFQITRLLQGDGQTSDTLVDFTIIAGSPEGVINIKRNAIPTVTSPSIDGVRVSHLASAVLSYVDVHITRAGLWQIVHREDDLNFLAAPFIVPDDLLTPGLADAVLSYALKPNVTGGSGVMDFPEWDVNGGLFAKPQTNNWAAWTGTPNRAAVDTATGTLTNALQHLKALIDDLISIGILPVGLPATMLYSDMLSLASYLVSENVVANLTDIFRVSVAPDTTAQAIYVPFGTLNSHTRYFMQGYSWSTANGRVEWSTFWGTWTIYNEAGTRLYHSGGTEANPWNVVQWKDEGASNVSVTTVAPNIPMTYNLLTDTHTAMIITGTTANAWDGLYLRVADVGGKRSYSLVGTGTNGKRIEWAGGGGGIWTIRDNSSTYATESDGGSPTYPDQVTSWSASVAMNGVNASELMAGVTIGGNATYNGQYVPVKGAYDNLGGKKLIYRRLDGAYYIEEAGSFAWSILNGISGTVLLSSNSPGYFPWNADWSVVGLTAQKSLIASPGWTAGSAFPSLNTTGNWHL